MKKLYPFILLILILSSARTLGQNPGDIIITEIMQNPNAVSDSNGEWFEVYNTTGAAIDMNGWTVRDEGANAFVITSALVVPANGYAVLGRNGDMATNGGVALDYVYSGSDMAIGNTDDEIIIEAPGPVVIDIVAYDGGPDFPNPTGASMELSQGSFNASDNDNGANWGEATTAFGIGGDLGSPGGDNDFTLTVVSQNEIEGFNLYPNPVNHGKLSIITAKNETKHVMIFDVLGKPVLNKIFKGRTLDVSSLNSGIYILKVKENTKTVTRKLVIR